MSPKPKIDQLKRGDVIRAVIPHQGEHTVIILEDYDPSKHIKCINACSFSSQPSQKMDSRIISIAGYAIPEFFFEYRKDWSYLRIDEVICLRKFEIRSRIGSLVDHKALWELICQTVSDHSALATIELDGICSCNCFEESPWPPFYCYQEISQLAPEQVEEYKQYGCISSCPCCGRVVSLEGAPVKCKCDDNLIVIIHDFHKNRSYTTSVVPNIESLS